MTRQKAQAPIRLRKLPQFRLVMIQTSVGPLGALRPSEQLDKFEIELFNPLLTFSELICIHQALLLNIFSDF